MGEKYIVATLNTPFHIEIRNILNPQGYIHGGNCDGGVSLLRLVRSYNPDFVVVDMNMQWRELKQTIETIDEEMLCFCILVGDYKNVEITSLIENSMVVSFCYKPLNREMFINSVEMASISFIRLIKLDKKLKEAKEDLHSKKLIERAKYILMEKESISENDAYSIIRKKSMDTRLSMKQVAEDIILSHKISERK
ncbi:UNVERIFIED_CONTAM: response regulator receiver and ANTAR domain protein [Acetivibrio alkalicellulosi]